jgi:hypothetical protein
VRRLLHQRLGWSVQRPQRQAKERDEEAIQHWVAHQRPRIDKGNVSDSAPPDGTRARLCFLCRTTAMTPTGLIGVLDQRRGFTPVSK